ncbi:MAG: alpha-N-arabinofuranosidase, partial [Defluviitaleaceae bacterium]|nr:alpha-N-arabinofuranosidase [Defluviitaleaceae bacterium]
LLITLLKNSDRVKIACLAQLVNVIAPIMTEKGGDAWRQTTFYPFMHAANYGLGTVLNPVVDSPTYGCEEFEHVPYVESIAVYNEEKKEVTIFAVSRSADENIDFEINLQGFDIASVVECSEMSGHDLKKVNTKGDGSVKPQQGGQVNINGSEVGAVLKPLSWNMIRLAVK